MGVVAGGEKAKGGAARGRSFLEASCEVSLQHSKKEHSVWRFTQSLVGHENNVNAENERIGRDVRVQIGQTRVPILL